MARAISTNEKKWEAQHDARTMAEASAISKDIKRRTAAQRAAMGMVKEKSDELAGLKNIAGRGKKK